MTTFPQLEAALSMDARLEDLKLDEPGEDDLGQSHEVPAVDDLTEPGKSPDPSMTGGDAPEAALDDDQLDDPVAVPAPAWSRSDDEVLPNRRGGRRRLKLSLRRR